MKQTSRASVDSRRRHSHGAHMSETDGSIAEEDSAESHDESSLSESEESGSEYIDGDESSDEIEHQNSTYSIRSKASSSKSRSHRRGYSGRSSQGSVVNDPASMDPRWADSDDGDSQLEDSSFKVTSKKSAADNADDWSRAELDQKLRHVCFEHSPTPFSQSECARVKDACLIHFDPMLNPSRGAILHEEDAHHSVRKAAADVAAKLHHMSGNASDTQGADHPIHTTIRSAAQSIVAHLSGPIVEPRVVGNKEDDGDGGDSGSDTSASVDIPSCNTAFGTGTGVPTPAHHHTAMRTAAADVHAMLDILLVNDLGPLGTKSRDNLMDAGICEFKFDMNQSPYGELKSRANSIKHQLELLGESHLASTYGQKRKPGHYAGNSAAHGDEKVGGRHKTLHNGAQAGATALAGTGASALVSHAPREQVSEKGKEEPPPLNFFNKRKATLLKAWKVKENIVDAAEENEGAQDDPSKVRFAEDDDDPEKASVKSEESELPEGWFRRRNAAFVPPTAEEEPAGEAKKGKKKTKKKKPPSEASSEKSSVFSAGGSSSADRAEADSARRKSGWESLDQGSAKTLTGALAEMSEVYKAAKFGVNDLSTLRQSKNAKAEALKEECNAWRRKSDELWHQIRDLRSQLHRTSVEAQ